MSKGLVWSKACLVAMVVLGWSASALAAIPATALIEGALTATGGGPVADGDYALTFSILKGEKGNALWTEGPTNVTVKNGQFVHALGSLTPLDPKLSPGVEGLWLGISVGADVLPAQPLHSTLFALRAGLSDGLECSGCVTAGQLGAKVVDDLISAGKLSKVAQSGAFADLSGGPDLSAYAVAAKLAKVATSGAYADLLGAPDLAVYAKAAALATVATSGSYNDLENLPVLAKLGVSCGTGLVVKGLKADGSYDCVVAMDPAALPGDGLDEISSGALTNQFTDVLESAKVPIAIPDNNPVGISDMIEVPDLGIAQVLTVSAEVTNSDTTQLVVNLIDPAGTKYVLWSKTAKGTAVKTTWPNPTKTVSGDLTTWVGKNPKGKWYLEVIDTAFLNNTTDGQIKAWSISVSTMSTNKVAATGTLDVRGALKLPVADVAPVTCNAVNIGYTYVNSKDKTLAICNGKSWYAIALDQPPPSCKDILKADASAASGVYTIDPDGPYGASPFAAYCDMTTSGGGWTLVMNVHPQDGGVVSFTNTNFWTLDKEYGTLDKRFTNDYKSQASYTLPGTAVLIEVATPDTSTVFGWKAWNMSSKTYDSFFDAAANTTQTISVIGADVANVYAYEAIIKNGAQLQSNRNTNPNADRVRLGVDGYPVQGDDNQPGLGSQMNEGACGVGNNCYRYRDVELWVNSGSNLWCSSPGVGSYGWIGTDGGCGGSCGSCDSTKGPPYTPYWTYRMFVR
ncbi:MAG: fibrinogen-like YCDxxxxGGGW domain-containing protein [Myxococcota bacterium]